MNPSLIKQAVASLLILTVWIAIFSLLAMLFFAWSVVMDVLGVVFGKLGYLTLQIGGDWFFAGAPGSLGFIDYLIAFVVLSVLFFASLAIVGAMGSFVVSVFRRLFGNKKSS